MLRDSSIDDAQCTAGLGGDFFEERYRGHGVPSSPLSTTSFKKNRYHPTKLVIAAHSLGLLGNVIQDIFPSGMVLRRSKHAPESLSHLGI